MTIKPSGYEKFFNYKNGVIYINIKNTYKDLKRIKVLGISGFIYIPILVTVIITIYLDIVPDEMIGALAVMLIVGGSFGFVGNILPFWRDLAGGGMTLSLIGGSYLVYSNFLTASSCDTINYFMKTTNFLNFYAAILLSGSILSINKKIILKSFKKFIPIILSGMIFSAVFGIVMGSILGISLKEILIFYFLPIMGSGTGTGAIPMSQAYKFYGGNPEEFLSRSIPIITLALIISIITGALLNRLGELMPRISGNGKLIKSNRTLIDEEMKKTTKLNQEDLISGLIVIFAFYFLATFISIKIFKQFQIHTFAWMVIIISLFHVLDIIPNNIRLGIRKAQAFFSGEISWGLMFGVGVTYVNLEIFINSFTLINLIMVITIVIGALIGSSLTGYLLGFYPIESGITAGLCMANTGGAGDLAVLSASKRMSLFSWAQISSRIGGAIMLIIASMIMSFMNI